jgi:hypothetical protein
MQPIDGAGQATAAFDYGRSRPFSSGEVIRVSLETVKLVAGLPKEFGPK